jgi:CDP-diacylglycerol---glycerol-3-phosphate 3-phosphatidyltransferase
MVQSGPVDTHPAALRSLQRRWTWLAVLSAAAALTGAALLWLAWEPGAAGIWLAVALAALAWQLAWVRGVLDSNTHRESGELLPTFGPGNALSLTRAALLSFLAGFLFIPRPPGGLAWLPAAVYILAAATDFFDGYLARRSGTVTALGEALDLRLDGLGVLLASLLAVLYGTLPWWYLPVPLARYLFLFGLWWRKQRSLPVHELLPSHRRRGLAGVQMGFIAAMLLPFLGPPGTHLAAGLFMLPFLIGFTYDWLLVSDRAGPSAAAWTAVWRATRDWLPLLLRGALAGLLGANLWTSAGSLPAGQILVETLTLGLVLLGAAPRFFAAAGLLAIGWRLQAVDFNPTLIAAVTAYIGILFLGSGRFSLWTPEEWHLTHRMGERTAADG